MSNGAAFWLGLCILLSGPSMATLANALKEIAEALRQRNRIEERRLP